jgi:hypothetical protein
MSERAARVTANANRDRLLNLLLGFAMLTAALPTLITYRAALQPQYHWGLLGLQGRGVTPGLFAIVAAALLAWAAVLLGSFRSRATGPLLVALNAVWFASILQGALLLGSQMTIRGDTFGVRINLAVVGPILFGVLLLLSIRWWWTHRHRLSGSGLPKPSRARRFLFAGALALLPAIVTLFALGDGVRHTWTDKIAVICVIAQCLLVGAGLHDIASPDA